MFESIDSSERNLAIQRLTALWALNECGLGGILHALNSPVTGLFVGSFAMICVAFICAFAENKWRAVMTSLIIVLIIKALVSPQSSPTAFIAVSFQGLTGALIYRFIPHLLPASVFFLTLGLLESAMQRLIMLTLLYGNTLWEAINIWGSAVTKRWGLIIPISSSEMIIYIYLAIHLFSGMLFGWLTYRAIKAVHAFWGQQDFRLKLTAENKKEFFKVPGGSKKKWKRFVLFGFLVLLIIFAYSGLVQDASNIQKGLIAILRAALILTVWFVFLAPLVIGWLQKFLNKKHKQLSSEVAHTMDMFPHMLWIIDKAWKETKHLRFLSRWKLFIIHTLLYILQYRTTYDSDPVRPDSKL